MLLFSINQEPIHRNRKTVTFLSRNLREQPQSGIRDVGSYELSTQQTHILVLEYPSIKCSRSCSFCRIGTAHSLTGTYIAASICASSTRSKFAQYSVKHEHPLPSPSALRTTSDLTLPLPAVLESHTDPC